MNHKPIRAIKIKNNTNLIRYFNKIIKYYTEKPINRAIKKIIYTFLKKLFDYLKEILEFAKVIFTQLKKNLILGKIILVIGKKNSAQKITILTFAIRNFRKEPRNRDREIKN